MIKLIINKILSRLHSSLHFWMFYIHFFRFRWTFAFCLELQIIKTVCFFFAISIILVLLFYFALYFNDLKVDVYRVGWLFLFAIYYTYHATTTRHTNRIAKFHTLVFMGSVQWWQNGRRFMATRIRKMMKLINKTLIHFNCFQIPSDFSL